MNAVFEALTSLGFDWHVALANLVNFFIIFFILKHFFFGSIQKTLVERRNKIEKGLIDAEEAEKLLQGAEAQKKIILKTAEENASQVLLETETKSKILAKTLNEEATEKAKVLLVEAEKNISKQRELSELEIQSRMPGLVADAIEKILRSKITKEENDKYVETLLAK